jgi:uncharacterized protein YciI
MGSAAVRAAVLKSSVANVTACVDVDEREDRWLTEAPVVDVRNVLEELARLQGLENHLTHLANAYANNTVMLAGIANAPDGLLGIMAECSYSTAKVLRRVLKENE